MTPAEMMDEIVKALEAIDPYIENGEIEEFDYNESVFGFRRALTLAKQLREGARTGWAEPYRGVDRWCFNFDPEKKYTNPDALPALLILSPSQGDGA